MLSVITSGESHGVGLTAVIDGFPANFTVDIKKINDEMKKRQQGYGRGDRQKIETDSVNILSGIRDSRTTGAPITFFVENKDYSNWQEIMGPNKLKKQPEAVTKFRPGHADYAGMIKYNQKDIRNILERSSARMTASQVAVGALCRQFLNEFKITIKGKILSIEKIEINAPELTKEAKERIDRAKREGTSLGGIFEIEAINVPIGLGSHVQPDRKLDGKLAGALMSLQAVKGVEIGLGFEAAKLPGHVVQDEMFIKKGKITRKTNNAGGIEGGISNGENITVRAAMKPIPTMTNPLKTVDFRNKKETVAHVERADICAIEAAMTVGEAITAIEITKAFLEKYGGDSIEEVSKHFYAM